MPSGILWRRYNIGASAPEDPGDYFSWGNVEGHPEGSGYNFSREVYDLSPGASITSDLTLEHDAARVILGGSWRMPTSDEFQELYDNCTSLWTQLNGVNGCLFTSNVNGHTLFLPAAGNYNGTTLSNRGSSGGYWSATYGSITGAPGLDFDSSVVNPQGSHGRRLGFTVRAVMDPTL